MQNFAIPLPLFCFGSLMDRDVLTLVSGQPLEELTTTVARLDEYEQRTVAEENYPVLVGAKYSSVTGLLVDGLTILAMQRILFFEGDEYELKPISVTVDNCLAEAGYFHDTGAYTTLPTKWDFATWQIQQKADFLDRIAPYMALFGTMTAAEADAHWQQN